MFEKEAEEYKKAIHREASREMVYLAFKDGAEHGYNKGYHDAEEHYMNVIDSQHKLVEESKANEWHYVKDEGTPKVEGHYLVCLRNEDMDVFDCWIYYDEDVGWYCMKVRMKDIYAWKEIVLPKEIE
jgi:hypothetical protein